MSTVASLAALSIASAGVGLQWLRFLRGEDISEPVHIPNVICRACPEPYENSVPEHRRFLLPLLAAPGFWLELFVAYLIGIHLVFVACLCKYGCRRTSGGVASGRRVGVRTRIEGAVPARHADPGDLPGGPRVVA